MKRRDSTVSDRLRRQSRVLTANPEMHSPRMLRNAVLENILDLGLGRRNEDQWMALRLKRNTHRENRRILSNTKDSSCSASEIADELQTNSR